MQPSFQMNAPTDGKFGPLFIPSIDEFLKEVMWVVSLRYGRENVPLR